MAGKEEDIIVLTDEDGVDHEFAMVDMINVEDNEYAILVPIDEGVEDSDEAVILKVETDEDGEETLVEIEDDAEWDRVAEAWEELLEEEDWDDEEFDDEDECEGECDDECCCDDDE